MNPLTDINEARRVAFRELALEHVPEDFNTGAEDVALHLPEGFGPYPGGDFSVGRFVSHTCSGELHYLYPCSTLADAKERTHRYVGDTIYAESPVAVHDLDTGDTHRPKLDTPWIKEGAPS